MAISSRISEDMYVFFFVFFGCMLLEGFCLVRNAADVISSQLIYNLENDKLIHIYGN